jgi:regulator of replication initiation timing
LIITRYIEIRKLKMQITGLQTKYSQLNRENSTLTRENKRLYDENRFLTEVNEAFANENDELRERLDQNSRIRLPRSMQGTDDRPSKRRKATSKGKKVTRLCDDELEDNSNSEVDGSEKDEQNEKAARVYLILNNFV